MKIEILPDSFDPWARVSAHEKHSELKLGAYGAATVFVGSMRDFNDGDEVRSMHLEHYPGMTEQHLERIAREALSRWPLIDVMILHRVGEVSPGDAIVLVATWSAHRAAAYDANRFIMEDLKSKAPFWKKEQLEGRARWVASNTSG